MGGMKCPARSGSAAACGSLNFMHNSPAFAADFISGLTRSIAGIRGPALGTIKSMAMLKAMERPGSAKHFKNFGQRERI